MSLIHNGTVQIETTSTNFQTWCTEANDVHTWPQDEVVCELQFGTYDTDAIKLQRFTSITIVYLNKILVNVVRCLSFNCTILA